MATDGGWDAGSVPFDVYGTSILPPAIGHVGQSFPRRLWEPDD